MNLLRFALPLLALLLLAPSCSDDENTIVTDERLAELEQEIQAIIEPPTATNLAQCQAIAFGAKACGGPKAYLIYSTAQTDEVRLRTLVTEYNRLDAERNQRLGLASDCALVVQPEVALAGGQCVAASAP